MRNHFVCVYFKPLRFFSFPAPKVRVKLKHPKLRWYWNLSNTTLLLRLSHTLKKTSRWEFLEVHWLGLSTLHCMGSIPGQTKIPHVIWLC